MANFYRYLDWQTLEITGPDTRDFLNRLTSVDFARLQPRAFSPGFLLHPNGKIILFFKALMLAQDHVILLIPGDSQKAFDILEKFHFRENLKFSPRKEQWLYVRIFGSDLQNTSFEEAEIFSWDENKWTKDFWNPHSMTTRDLGILIPKTKEPLKLQEWKAAGIQELLDIEPIRIAAGDPAVPNELGPIIIPLEAEMDDSVHENKGCYPGQEVIEKIRTIGQVPRKLVIVRGHGLAPTPPAVLSIRTGDKCDTAGSITSIAPMRDHWIGLGFIKRLYSKEVENQQFFIDEKEVEVKLKS